MATKLLTFKFFRQEILNPSLFVFSLDIRLLLALSDWLRVKHETKPLKTSSVFLEPEPNSSRSFIYKSKHVHRKPWYQRAIDVPTLWNLLSKPAKVPKTKPTLWNNASATNSKTQELRKSTSLRVATSLTSICPCVPISSHNHIFHQPKVPPRRSYSFPRTKTFGSARQERFPSARISIDGRRIFRGNSLADDVSMRRFVMEEEAMMQVRRRNQMEIIRKRVVMRRKNIGPSPLGRM